ncbi:hypothetical protein HF673_17630, partial [Acidithiobacillus thiooxidans]|uniref:hypothetical protein n=1 Tax=Acidithiobacillus thiooxidans TaxID=930 RepID=UPI001C07B0AE
MDSAPIFIHSLFRSGSTYLFHVFRRSNLGYWCYQEPLHELAFFCRANPSGLNIDHGGSKRRLLRHPEINGSYFRELQETWPAWKDVITERIIYDAYFAPLNEDFGLEYWRALADKAHGRTVFQECRTSGRIGIIKKEIGGYHIYLWRNPWDQWWSYKVNSYFNCANQLIIHAYQAPAPVQNLRAALDLPSYLGEDIKGAFEFYGKRPLASEQSYQVFYMLWCLALHEGKACADILLNIDRLGNSKEHQFEMLSKLKIQSVDGIDFSDCRIPQGRYSEEEQKFFTKLESQVHEWLLEGGWSQPDIDQIHVLRQQYQPTAWNLSVDNLDPRELAEQASRARIMVKNLETSLAERVNYANAQAAQASERAILAESQAAQASERAILAESQAAQASERAILAES